MKVKNSHARQIPRVAGPIKNIRDVILYSEPACLKTCMDLFEKNIRTTMNDTEGVLEDLNIQNGICKVTIDYNSLDEENKKTALILVEEGKAKFEIGSDNNFLSIIVSCNGNNTIGEISKELLLIASKFKKQDILYGKKPIDEEYSNICHIVKRYPFLAKYMTNESVIDDILKINHAMGTPLIFDSEEKIFWECPEYFRMHLNFLRSEKYDEFLGLTRIKDKL